MSKTSIIFQVFLHGISESGNTEHFRNTVKKPNRFTWLYWSLVISNEVETSKPHRSCLFMFSTHTLNFSRVNTVLVTKTWWCLFDAVVPYWYLETTLWSRTKNGVEKTICLKSYICHKLSLTTSSEMEERLPQFLHIIQFLCVSTETNSNCSSVLGTMSSMTWTDLSVHVLYHLTKMRSGTEMTDHLVYGFHHVLRTHIKQGH